MIQKAGNEKGGLAKILMGPERAVSFGEESWGRELEGLIGWKEG